MAVKSITFTSGWSRKTYTVGGVDDRGLTITKIKLSRGMYEIQCKKADGKKANSSYIAAHNVTNVS